MFRGLFRHIHAQREVVRLNRLRKQRRIGRKRRGNVMFPRKEKARRNGGAQKGKAEHARRQRAEYLIFLYHNNRRFKTEKREKSKEKKKRPAGI